MATQSNLQTRPNAVGRMLGKGVSYYYGGLRNSLKYAQLTTYSTNAFLEGGFFPAFEAVLEMKNLGENVFYGG